MHPFGGMEPTVPPFTTPKGRWRRCGGDGQQRRVCLVRVHAYVSLGPRVLPEHERQFRVAGPAFHLLHHFLRSHVHRPFAVPRNCRCQRRLWLRGEGLQGPFVGGLSARRFGRIQLSSEVGWQPGVVDARGEVHVVLQPARKRVCRQPHPPDPHP